LKISEELAESIIDLGLKSFDDIAYASKKKLLSIFEEEEEIQRVKSAAEDAALLEAMSEVEKDEQDQESLTDLELSEEQVNALSKSGIKNKDDLAELATDELMEIIDITEEIASEMIMKAREHWFK
jgi:Bacterial RNA polymerase, alpha chain C terminal domain.